MAREETIRLNMLGLPVIQSIDDFSLATHVSNYSIYQLSKHSNKYYRTYDIPKKSGGKRIICQPSRKLKGIQSWLLINILNKVQVSSSCKGFQRGSSILENVNPHIGATSILNLDIKDFFPSIESKQVFHVFKTLGYNNLVSTIFSNMCTYEGRLPQGSPCSPMLSNLITWNLDLRIQGYVGKYGINYTRYADDLTFSGLNPSKVVKIIPMIKRIIIDEGFNVNHKKTRIASTARAKIVTGLIINEDSAGIGKKKYKELRAKIHHLTIASEQKNETLLYHVGGWLSYLNVVDKPRLEKAKNYIHSLSTKYPETLVVRLDKPRTT